MKISTWNVNSINARIEHLEKFIKKDQSDIYLLQELKTIEDGFPREITPIRYIFFKTSRTGFGSTFHVLTGKPG